MNIDWKKSVIILSGGFDPIHKGHMRMFREASNLGHQVIVGLNSDEWLTRKKGKPFMEFYERKEILEGFKYISSVVKFDDKDDTAIGKGFKLPLVISISIKARALNGKVLNNILKKNFLFIILLTFLLHQNLIVNLSIFHIQ